MVDISIPRKLNTSQMKQLKEIWSWPDDTQLELFFRGMILTHPNEIKERLKHDE